MKKIFLLTIIILMTASTTFAQSQYVSDKQNTIETAIGFQANSSKTPGIGIISTGLGIRGEFDIGLQVGILSGDKIYAPYFNIILLSDENSSQNSFNFTLFVQPEFHSDSKITNKGVITVGSTYYHDLFLTQKTIFQPYLIGAYTNGTPKGVFSKGGGFSFFHRGDNIIPVLKIGVLNNMNNTSGFITLSIITIKG